MESFKFTFGDKTFELNEENCEYLLLEEEKEVEGIDVPDILKLLNEADEVNFDMEYYKIPCENCFAGKEERLKYFNFLEYHFYIFTKDLKYVTSSISKEFKNTSFTRLLKQGEVDDSFIVSIIVCESCGGYSIEIEQCDM